jgi:hypothetical protein
MHIYTSIKRRVHQRSKHGETRLFRGEAVQGRKEMAAAVLGKGPPLLLALAAVMLALAVASSCSGSRRERDPDTARGRPQVRGDGLAIDG